MAEPKDENGNWKLDTKNPNENLRLRKKIGLVILHNLKWDDDQKESNGGQIYDSREDDTHSLFPKTEESNTLKLRGIYRIFAVWKNNSLETFQFITKFSN